MKKGSVVILLTMYLTTITMFLTNISIMLIPDEIPNGTKSYVLDKKHLYNLINSCMALAKSIQTSINIIL